MTDKESIREAQDRRIEELEQEVEILKSLVLFDPLTGLYTRNGFKEQVMPFFHEIEYAREHPDKRKSLKIDTLTLLFIDIDNFKQINDEQGHAKGDSVLKKVSQAIDRNVRASDFVGRWGGEEIVVALLGASEQEGAEIAEKVRDAVSSATEATISVGVAELTGPVSTFNELVSNADKAMYKAKKGGKNTVVAYSELYN